MVERKYFAILTDIGQQKVSAFASGGEKVNITAFVVGDANGEYYTPTTDMTAIKNEVWRGVVSSADVVKDAQKVMRVSTVIPAEVNGFIVREMGLYDESGQLIAIGNTPPMPKVMLEEGVSTELDLSMRFAVKNTEALTFLTDPHTVIMTKDMLDTHDVDDNAHKELLAQKVDNNKFTTELAKKVDETKLTTELAKKVDETKFTTELAKKVDETKLTTELAKKANTSHSHNANDITSTMPIANGGTGATTASTALSNLGGFPTAGGTITGNTTIQGNLTLKSSSSNYGNKINFGDGDYVHLYEVSDDKLEIKASNINFVVSGNITKNGNTFGEKMTKSEIDSIMKGTGTGRDNTALGYDTLQNNTTGNENVALGYTTLRYNTIGSGNTAVGTGALQNNTTGEYNTAIGDTALLSNTTGGGNIAIGKSALLQSNGNDNTAIGHSALILASTYNNCTGLGQNSQVTGSNQVQLGDTSATVYAQKALVTRSDARDKIDIEDSPLGLNFILQLRPRKYRMNSREAYFEPGQERDFSAQNDGSKAGKRPHYGLVAQEVKEVMNELNVDFAGYLDSKIDGGEDVLSLGYTEFIAPMIKAIQEQQQMIEELQKQIEEWKK